MLDLVIIGAGPAGLSAAVYAQRAALRTRMLEPEGTGGQLADAVEVENYPGIAQISGYDLAQAMQAHAEALGSTLETAGVKNLVWRESHWEVRCTDGRIYAARAVIAATGTQRRRLEVPGERRYTGRGVSYCATCDGFFFRGKTVVVVGGGDTAVDDAIFLSNMAEHVYVVHRRDTLRANKRRQQLLRTRENVTFVWHTVVTAIQGDGQRVTSVALNARGAQSELAADGVFVAVGAVPNTACLPDALARDAAGYVRAGEDGRTNLPGLFAAGDVRTKPLRQIVTAAADGACCVASAEQYLQEK